MHVLNSKEKEKKWFGAIGKWCVGECWPVLLRILVSLVIVCPLKLAHLLKAFLVSAFD